VQTAWKLSKIRICRQLCPVLHRQRALSRHVEKPGRLGVLPASSTRVSGGSHEGPRRNSTLPRFHYSLEVGSRVNSANLTGKSGVVAHWTHTAVSALGTWIQLWCPLSPHWIKGKDKATATRSCRIIRSVEFHYSLEVWESPKQILCNLTPRLVLGRAGSIEQRPIYASFRSEWVELLRPTKHNV